MIVGSLRKCMYLCKVLGRSHDVSRLLVFDPEVVDYLLLDMGVNRVASRSGSKLIYS